MAYKATVLLPALDAADPADDDVVSRRFRYSLDGAAPIDIDSIPVEQLQVEFTGEPDQSAHCELFQSDAAGNESATPRVLDFALTIPDVTPPPTPGELSVGTIEDIG